MAIQFKNKTFNNITELFERIIPTVSKYQNNNKVLIKMVHDLKPIINDVSKNKSSTIKNFYINTIINMFKDTEIQKDIIKTILTENNSTTVRQITNTMSNTHLNTHTQSNVEESESDDEDNDDEDSDDEDNEDSGDSDSDDEDTNNNNTRTFIDYGLDLNNESDSDSDSDSGWSSGDDAIFNNNNDSENENENEDENINENLTSAVNRFMRTDGVPLCDINGHTLANHLNNVQREYKNITRVPRGYNTVNVPEHPFNRPRLDFPQSIQRQVRDYNSGPINFRTGTFTRFTDSSSRRTSEPKQIPVLKTVTNPKIDYTCVITGENCSTTGGFMFKKHEKCAPKVIISNDAFKMYINKPPLKCIYCSKKLKDTDFVKVHVT